MCHLLVEPGLLVTAVFVCNGFVLSPDLRHDLGQILLRCSVHLDVDVAGQLRAQGCQFLKVAPRSFFTISRRSVNKQQMPSEE